MPGKLVCSPGEAHPCHHVLHRPPTISHLIDAADKIEVFEHRKILVQAEALCHVADLTLDPGGIGYDVEAETGSSAAVRRQQTAKHADRCRLAAAIGAEEATHLARRHL